MIIRVLKIGRLLNLPNNSIQKVFLSRNRQSYAILQKKSSCLLFATLPVSCNLVQQQQHQQQQHQPKREICIFVASHTSLSFHRFNASKDKGNKTDATIKTSTSDGKQKSISNDSEPIKITSNIDDESIESHVNSPNDSNDSKLLEITTNKGKLIVTTTTTTIPETAESSGSSDGGTGGDRQIHKIIFEKKSSNETPCHPTITPSNTPGTILKKDATKIEITEEDPKKTRRRTRVDVSRTNLERNFITPARAMSDFLLKQSDLDKLPKIKRRSPYEQEPPITVYWRKDVEEKAIEVWGSRENLLRECLKREIEKKTHQQNIFTVKRRLRDYRKEIGSRTGTGPVELGLSGSSGRVVITAIAINMTNFVFKTCAWLYTGSHSMFAESIHSLADTINQLILAFGIHKSVQRPDTDHPYGYANMKYVSSLISGVGIFCVGTGLSLYHGVMGLLQPTLVFDYFWAFCILGGSLISEGATLLVAVNTIRRDAKQANLSFKEYVVRGQDPCVNVVLFEDTAAVLSVLLAGGCMGFSTYFNSSVPDAIGSLLVGGILGAVASFIIYSNVNALVGRSIAMEHLEKINSELESDVMIRAIHDVKGIDMGNSLVRYKAEMDFDGRELTRFYLDKQDLNALLEEVKQFTTIDELEAFLLKNGENIVDLMGGEIDRIELKLRKKFPEIRHCDLEIL